MNLTRTWLYFLLGCMITNPSFVQLIIYTGNNVYNEDPQNFKSLFRTIYTFKKVDKSKSSEPTEQYEVPVEEPPLLAKWITSAWKFIKNPKAAMDRRTIKTLLENSFNNDEPLISNDRVIEFLELAKSKVAEFADQMLVNSADLNEVTDQENMAKLAVTIKQWASSDRAEIEDFSASSLDFLKEQMVKPIHSEEE